MIKFSIIVPVYKVECFLSKCIDSILCQDYKDFELILINDGSPDNCPLICDEYAKRDSRIKVLHKENGGLSSARNVGIDIASGEYVLFVDSDDYWDSLSSLSLLEKELDNKSDVIVFGRKKYDLLKKSVIHILDGYNKDSVINKSKCEVLKYLFLNNLFPVAAWVTVSKRSFLLENRIYFIEGIKAEDIDWLIHSFYKAKHISVIDASFYVYLINREGSITNRADLKSIIDILFTIEKWESILDPNKETDRYFLSHLAYEYAIALYLSAKLSHLQYKEIEGRLEDLSYILKFGIRFNIKCIYYMSKILSVKLLANLIKFIYTKF